MIDNERWVFGYNPLKEALKSDSKIKTIYINEKRSQNIKDIILMANAKGVDIKYQDKHFFDSRFPKGHQGLAAIIEKKAFISVDELLKIPSSKKEPPFYLILDLIEDPRNFGAILRVADVAGIHGVVFQLRRSAGITGIVSKSSAGALEHLNLVETVNIKHVIDKMKEVGIYVIGAEVNAQACFWDIDMTIPLAFVIGSEGKGLRRTVRERCDMLVNIPLRGNVNSLNVSVATGILIYEALRQRQYFG